MNLRDSFLTDAQSASLLDEPAASTRAQALLEAVTRVQAAFLATTKTQPVFAELLDALAAFGESPLGFVGEVLFDSDKRPYLKICASSDMTGDLTALATDRRRGDAGAECRDLDTLLGASLRTGEVVIVNDPANDPRATGLPAGHPPLTAFVGIPLEHDGRLIGVIGLANRAGGYSDRWLAHLQPLLQTARTLMVAIRARAERDQIELSLERSGDQLRLARERAERTELQLRSAIESLDEGFVLFDRDDRLVICNTRYLDFYRESSDLIRTGITFEDLLRGRVERGQYPEAAGREEDWIQRRLAAHRRANVVMEHRFPDGTWLRITERRTADGGCVGFRVDITELKRATERAEAAARELHSQQTKFGAAFRNSADYMSIVRLSDRKFIEVNDAFTQMSGYTREEAVGRKAEELDLWCHPEQRDHVMKQLQESGVVRDVMSRLRRKDGKEVEVSVAAALIDIGDEQGVLWTLRDVTAQKAALEAVRASENKFAAAFRDSADCMSILRLSDRTFIEVNDAFTRMTGYAREQAVGRGVTDLYLWVEPRQREQALRALEINHGHVANFPCRLRRRDGTVLHCLMSASIIDVDGKRCELATLRDISDRVAAEDASKQLNKQLQASVAMLEQVNHQNLALSEMRDLLHTCQTVDEVHRVAAHFVPRLVPDTVGALYLMSGRSAALESVFAWGDQKLAEHVFGADACWALRRGRPYFVADPASGLKCDHVHGALRGGCLCLPMSVQGDVHGILHLQFDSLPDDDPLTIENRENYLRTITEHIALAMSNARLRENLRQQASRDPLTGLINRRSMDESFERELRRCARRKAPMALMMVDIDHFKRFNDQYGHEAGDHVLKLVAEVLLKSVRFEDYVCRHGGEEMLILLPEADAAAVAQRAEVTRSRVAALAPVHRDVPLGSITISIGTAVFPAQGDTRESLIRAADAALYEAKRTGRDRVVAAGAHSADAATAG